VLQTVSSEPAASAGQTVRDETAQVAPVVAAVPSASLAVMRTAASEGTSEAPAPVMHYYGQRTVVPAANAESTGSPLTLFAVRSGSVYAVSQYSQDNGTLSYTLPSGSNGSISLEDIDWETTTKLNSERNVQVTLKSRVSDN
jgi:hypothetical protein